MQTDETLPRDLDEFLVTLQRQMGASDPTQWTRCVSRRCRRARCCADASLACPRTRSLPPMSDEEHAEMIATLQRDLRASMTQRGG